MVVVAIHCNLQAVNMFHVQFLTVKARFKSNHIPYRTVSIWKGKYDHTYVVVSVCVHLLDFLTLLSDIMPREMALLQFHAPSKGSKMSWCAAIYCHWVVRGRRLSITPPPSMRRGSRYYQRCVVMQRASTANINYELRVNYIVSAWAQCR